MRKKYGNFCKKRGFVRESLFRDQASVLRRPLTLLIVFFLSQPAYGRWLVGSKAKGERQSYNSQPIAAHVSNFWRKHKMDVSGAINGYFGTFGVSFGVHFHPQWSFDLGFGGSSHYQSFGFRLKKSFLMSSPLSPYIATGFSRWHRTRSRDFDLGEVSPDYLAQELMSEEDRINNIIDERLIHGAVGLQYVMTEGDWKGLAAHIEALLLMDFEDVISVPTVAIGLGYYF